MKSLIGFGRLPHGTPDRVSFSRALRGPAGAEVAIVAQHDRAGTERTSLRLQ